MKGTRPWHSYEAIDKYESLFPLLPNYVVHRTLGIRGLQIGLSKQTPYGLTRKLLAALTSYKLRIGLSYAEQRYVKDAAESRWLGLTNQIDDLFSYGQSRLDRYASSSSQVPKQDGTYHDLSVQFFFRNVVAFDAAKRLSEFGYLCEVASILRTALEQFAFCARLWNLPSDQDLQSVRPVQSLNFFKGYVPAAGQLYGLLSKYTHFEYEHHTHFFTLSPKEIFTIRFHPTLRAYATHLLFLTMVCVSEYVLKIAPIQFTNVPESIAELAEFIKQVDKYSDSVCSILPMDSVLANLDIVLQDITRQ